MNFRDRQISTVTEFLDIQLIESCIKGDRASQKALYDRLAPRMFPLCIRYVCDRDTAEDVLQDGFVTLFTKLDNFYFGILDLGALAYYLSVCALFVLFTIQSIEKRRWS